MVHPSVSDHIDAWRLAVGTPQRFRQITSSRRSLWPEADSIRGIAKAHIPRHAPIHRARPYFPRAELGLPIVFQFKQDPPGPPKPPPYQESDPKKRDPSPHTLQPTEAPGYPLTPGHRMASPFVLKPLMLEPDLAVPLALLLDAPLVSDLVARKQLPPLEVRHSESEAEPVDAIEILDPSKTALVTPLLGKDNAREGFMAFMARDGWRPEVQF